MEQWISRWTEIARERERARTAGMELAADGDASHGVASPIRLGVGPTGAASDGGDYRATIHSGT